MTGPEPARRWDPQPGDGDRIWAHLLRQRGLDPAVVEPDGPRRVVPVGDGDES